MSSLRRGEIGAERLLDDDPLPTRSIAEAGLLQIAGDQAEDRWRGRHVEEDITAGLILGVQFRDQLMQAGEGRLVPELAWGVIEALAEMIPDRRVEFLAGVKRADVAGHPLTEVLRRQLVHGDPDDGELLGQEAVAGEVVEGRHQQALGQVARGAEDDQDARIAGRPGTPGARPGERDGLGRRHAWSSPLGLGAGPPKRELANIGRAVRSRSASSRDPRRHGGRPRRVIRHPRRHRRDAATQREGILPQPPT